MQVLLLDIKNKIERGESLAPFRQEGVTLPVLIDQGAPVESVFQAGFGVEDFITAGFTDVTLIKLLGVTRLKAAGWNAKRMRSAGSGVRELFDAGVTLPELQEAGFADVDLQEVSVLDLEADGSGPQKTDQRLGDTGGAAGGGADGVVPRESVGAAGDASAHESGRSSGKIGSVAPDFFVPPVIRKKKSKKIKEDEKGGQEKG